MRAHWALLRELRVHLGCSLTEINAWFQDLKRAGLVEGVRSGDAAAVRDAKEVLAARRADRGASREENVPGTSAVKIMLWAIDKCGSVEAARRAFDGAMRALEGP